MSRSHWEKEEWERRRWYLTRSLFQDLPQLTPIHETADHEFHSDSSESLPDLIVQVVSKRECVDDPEESYQQLENIIKKQLKRDADITNRRLLSDTEFALTGNLDLETASNEDPNCQECSIDSVLEAMRCPGITSCRHTEIIPIINHSLDSPQTPLALLKISTPTQLPHSSASTNSSPQHLVTPSSSTQSLSKSPISSTKPRRISTHSSPKRLTSSESSSTGHSSRKRKTSVSSSLTRSSPKHMPSPTELSSKRRSSLALTARRSSRKRPTSLPSSLTHSSPKHLPLSTELSSHQLLVVSPSRHSSRKRQPSLTSPLTHSSPKRRTRSALPLRNSQTQPLTSPTKSSRQSTKGLTSLHSKSRHPSRRRPSLSDAMRENMTLQHSPILSAENSNTPQSSGPRNIEKSLQTSISNNDIRRAVQNSIYNNPLDKAIQTSLCNSQLNRAVQTSPIGDDSTNNFWRNIFVGEPVIYNIVPRRNPN